MESAPGQRRGAEAHYWCSLTQLVEVLIARGQLDEATELLTSTGIDAQPWERLSALGSSLPGPLARGQLMLAGGHPEQAIEHLLTAGPWLEERGWTNPAANPWRAMVAPALAAVGRVERAREVIEPAVRRACAFGAPWALGMTLRAAGAVAEGSEAVGLLEEAIVVLDGAGCTLELAHAQLELGANLRRDNLRASAREHLRAALELAQRCGAEPLASKAREDLRATGARLRRVMLIGIESLTPCEQRIARLAAAGLSNPAIAQRLFVTRKTVETHLHHVYQKLEIDSRAALPEALR